MAFSIRTRLTFWYVTLLTASLLAFAGVFTYTLFNIFIQRVDVQISSVANMMVHTVIKPSGQIILPKDFDIILDKFFGIRTAGNYIQILDVHGLVIAKSSNLGDARLPISKEAYEAAVSGATTFENVRRVLKFQVRIVTKPIVLKEQGLVAIVQVGYSLEGMDEILNAVASLFIYVMLGAIVIAGGAGWFLARKSLKPVNAITKAARRIGAENLFERLAVDVPKDEIGMLAATINEMIGRLEGSFMRIRQFTADASHELKTPLTVLKGEIEMALRAKDDPAYTRQVLLSSLEEIDRMSYIVRTLLDLAMIDAEKGVASGQTVRLDNVLTERFEHFKKLALDRRVELVIIKNKAVSIAGDPLRAGQLFYNLIVNALKYTPAGGRVEVSLDIVGAKAVFKVKDTGIGISVTDLPYVFDRFYRVDKARTSNSGDEPGGRGEAGGAGLGLSICKEIVVAMGGVIEVKSEMGKGTIFTVRLPIAQ
ncbi:MAG: HAMP domain-containing protein [Deltaproteobacteria bacterium]|nr:HAMP domain-containing protein [Deltaproteobacteria bacterium]